MVVCKISFFIISCKTRISGAFDGFSGNAYNNCIVWDNGDLGEGNGDIGGQAYSNSGLAIGDEFQINSYTLGDQRFPDIAMNDDGRFVVVWESDGQDGDGWGIFAETGFIPEPATLGLLLLGGLALLRGKR